ncbi:MAG: HEAT repeat domain-containing protein, partial [Clostridiales bacterium]
MLEFDFQTILMKLYDVINRIKNDNQLFWLVIGGVIALAVVLIVIICISSAEKKKSSKNKQQGSAWSKQALAQQMSQKSANMPRIDFKTITPPQIFIDIEQGETAVNTTDFLSLTERILLDGEHLSAHIRERIIKRSPKSLDDIVLAMPNALPLMQEELVQLVNEQDMLAAYTEKLLSDQQYSVDTLLKSWTFFADTKLIERFVELLGHKDERVQMIGVKVLSGLQDQKSIAPLAMALMQPSRYVTARVADVFASLGKSGARLLVYLLPEIENENKVRVLQTLSQIKAEYPVENVVICLNDANPLVRVAAIEVLENNRDLNATSALIIATEDSDAKVRAAAVKALGVGGNQEAIPVLTTLTKDPDWVVAA